MQDHEIRPLYFDVAGEEMTKADFLKAYPARLPIARATLLRTLICTEFVGIDHRVAATRRVFVYPLIYETTVTLQVQGFSVVRSFAWSGGFKRAWWLHGLACVAACVGGGLWWRYCAYRGDDNGQGSDI